MKIEYAFSMPNKWTFKMKPIWDYVLTVILKHTNILFPFAGFMRFAQIPTKNFTYIDISTDLPKPYIQGDIFDVLPELIKKQQKYDLIISDPPYSFFQSLHSYAVNTKVIQQITQLKQLYNQLLENNGEIIHCGYNTTGMSKKHGYEKTNLLIVNCGGSHNDFLVLTEQKKKV